MGKDFEKGLTEGLKMSGVDMNEVELIKELIGQGGDVKVEEALAQLLGYHDVDIVTGITSSFVMTGIAEKFEKGKKLLLNNNLGEQLVQATKLNDYVFLNSTHLYQQCWLLGQWSGSTLGENALVCSALYDVGYSFQLMFDLGVRKEIPEFEIKIETCPMPEPGGLSNLELAFNRIEEVKPDYVFAQFCGEESTMFLEGFVERGFHKNTTLLGLPFLMVPGEKSLEGLKVITPYESFDSDNPDVACDDIFKQLGIESGQVIGAVIQDEEHSDLDALNALVGSEKFRKLIATKNPVMNGPVYIVEHEFGANNEITSKVIHSETVSLENEEEYLKLYDMDLSGWMNPYLAI